MKCGRGGGGCQKSRNFCGRPLCMVPYGRHRLRVFPHAECKCRHRNSCRSHRPRPPPCNGPLRFHSRQQYLDLFLDHQILTLWTACFFINCPRINSQYLEGLRCKSWMILPLFTPLLLTAAALSPVILLPSCVRARVLRPSRAERACVCPSPPAR